MKRYKVEFESKDKQSFFVVTCYENELEKWKRLCKDFEKDGICYYREFPLTNAKKVYF